MVVISYNLDSIDAAEKLLSVCRKYRNTVDIDIVYGRYIVDAFSILGVHSLIGHIVTVVPQIDDKDLIEKIRMEIEEIGH